VRGKKREARRGALRLAGAQANAAALECVLLDRGHGFVTSDDGAHPDGGKTDEQGASLWRESFVADHRNAPCDARERNLQRAPFGWRQGRPPLGSLN